MTKTLTASLLVIGNEILSGRTQDTNTSWIASKLAERGIKMVEGRIVADVEEDIIFAVNELKSRTDYLFTTGGIGPTHDDITSATLAKVFGLELETNQTAVDMLRAYYETDEQLTPARLKMAQIPVGAKLIPNPVSGAPGFKIENVYVLAGIPRIMQAMLDMVLPDIDGGPPILSNTVTCDLLESEVAEELGKIQDNYPDVSIGSYPHFRSGHIALSLVLRSSKTENLHVSTNEVIDMVRRLGGEPRAVSIKTAAQNPA